MGLSPSAFVIGPDSFENDIRSDRKVIELLVGGLSGVQDEAAFAVSPVAGQHQISIAAGVATLAGRSTPASQGSYLAWSDAADVVALPAVQSDPFIVAVVLRVADPQYGVVSGSVGARYDLVPGTAAPSPVAPSDSSISSYGGGVPGAWIRLADVRINTGDTGAIPAGQITDTRGYYVSGGLVVAGTSAVFPPHKPARQFFAKNTGLSYVSNGVSWIPIPTGDTGWTQSGMVMGSGWAAAASGTWAALAYRVIGGVCYVNGTATKSSWSGNDTLATLPVGARPRAQFQTHDVRVQSTGVIAPSGAGTTVFGVDIRYPVG